MVCGGFIDLEGVVGCNYLDCESVVVFDHRGLDISQD